MIMTMNTLIGKLNEYLHLSTSLLIKWLRKMLHRISDDWWQECVIDKLSYNQSKMVSEKNITCLEQFDLAALLRIADRNWYAMRDFAYLPTKEREIIREMMTVRNNWAHCSGSSPSKEAVLFDIDTVICFLELMECDYAKVNALRSVRNEIDSDYYSLGCNNGTGYNEEEPEAKNNKTIKEKDIVCLIGQPDSKGVVLSVEQVGNQKKYNVFLITR